MFFNNHFVFGFFFFLLFYYFLTFDLCMLILTKP